MNNLCTTLIHAFQQLLKEKGGLCILGYAIHIVVTTFCGVMFLLCLIGALIHLFFIDVSSWEKAWDSSQLFLGLLLCAAIFAAFYGAYWLFRKAYIEAYQQKGAWGVAKLTFKIAFYLALGLFILCLKCFLILWILVARHCREEEKRRKEEEKYYPYY